MRIDQLEVHDNRRNTNLDEEQHRDNYNQDFKKRHTYYAERKSSDFKKKTKKYAAKTSCAILNEPIPTFEEQYRVNKNILDLQNKIGVEIIQKNGQRKLGGPPPGWKGSPPEAGSEVFVGRIPRNIYEDVIYPIFSKIGKIYEMRLMMNFSGTNRGFGFIMYANPSLAQKAIRELDNYEIFENWRIGVVESVNNCRLHITDLPSQIDVSTIIQRIWPVCEEVDRVYLFTNLTNAKVKHALISFKTHRSAAMARRRLLPERNRFFDKAEVKIEWAHPNISIINVIEESGVINEKGDIEILSKKIIKSNKKVHYEETVKKVAPKNWKNQSILMSSKPRATNKTNMLKKPQMNLQTETNCTINYVFNNQKSLEFDENWSHGQSNSNYNFRLFDDFKFSCSQSDPNCNSQDYDAQNQYFLQYLNPSDCSFPFNVLYSTGNKLDNVTVFYENSQVARPILKQKI